MQRIRFVPETATFIRSVLHKNVCFLVRRMIRKAENEKTTTWWANKFKPTEFLHESISFTVTDGKVASETDLQIFATQFAT